MPHHAAASPAWPPHLWSSPPSLDAFGWIAPTPIPAASDGAWSAPQTPAAPPPPRRRFLPGDLSPPLIAMLAVFAAAFLVVACARLRRRLRRRRRRLGALDSPRHATGGGDADAGDESFGSASDYFFSSSPYGLDDAAIKALPVSLFSPSQSARRDCAVCLLEFAGGDALRTLPVCGHAFHADCIDVWLRAHATCPLCRSPVLRPDSPFLPMRAARIRPSLDDLLFFPPPPPPPNEPEPEIAALFDDRIFLLKRSYSFGFERNVASERLVLEPATASPWRYRQRWFWSKRWPSPFSGGGGGGGGTSRVFSSRSYYRVGAGPKSSPFSRRRVAFFPQSSEPVGLRLGSSARPSRGAASRTRSGDPEALLSPERLRR